MNLMPIFYAEFSDNDLFSCMRQSIFRLHNEWDPQTFINLEHRANKSGKLEKSSTTLLPRS